MTVIKNIIVAFSLYSRIPMPIFEWKEEDMKHNLIFLPWIGLVIGLVSLAASFVFGFVNVPLIAKTTIYTLIPLLITGGFHLDGYMDVQDALKSYKSSEEKLEILKDPHIGAFAIIRLCIFGLTWISSIAILINNDNIECLYLYMLSFAIVRGLAAIYSLKLKHARKSGMLHMETEKTNKLDIVALTIELMILVFVGLFINIYATCLMGLFAFVHFFYYKKLCYKNFNGVTGDTTGFSIVTLEGLMLLVLAVFSFWTFDFIPFK